MNNIQDIISTKERIKILDNIIYLENEFGVNEIAKKIQLSKGLISKYFEILLRNNVLSKRKIKFIVNNNNIVKSFRILLNIIKIDTKLFQRYKFIKAIGLYGSCVKGTNTESSDIDLWIKISLAKEQQLADLISQLKKTIKNINILILDHDKIIKLKKEDILFYHSLFFGSIIIYGDENEI
jgi:predicted nucleotidyltransferase